MVNAKDFGLVRVAIFSLNQRFSGQAKGRSEPTLREKLFGLFASEPVAQLGSLLLNVGPLWSEPE